MSKPTRISCPAHKCGVTFGLGRPVGAMFAGEVVRCPDCQLRFSVGTAKQEEDGITKIPARVWIDPETPQIAKFLPLVNRQVERFCNELREIFHS